MLLPRTWSQGPSSQAAPALASQLGRNPLKGSHSTILVTVLNTRHVSIRETAPMTCRDRQW